MKTTYSLYKNNMSLFYPLFIIEIACT